MERRRLMAFAAGIACLLLGLAAGCNSDATTASPSPDAMATPATTGDKMAAPGDKMAAPADKMGAPTPPPAPPGPAAKP